MIIEISNKYPFLFNFIQFSTISAKSEFFNNLIEILFYEKYI